MIVSPNELRRDVVQLLKDIEIQIMEVEKTSKIMGIAAHEMRDSHGNWVMIQLLSAKTQAYSMLVQLNEQGKK